MVAFVDSIAYWVGKFALSIFMRLQKRKSAISPSVDGFIYGCAEAFKLGKCSQPSERAINRFFTTVLVNR